MDKCPVCGMPVRVIYRSNGAADHYEPILANDFDNLPEVDTKTKEYLRELRLGYKTVAMIGTATTSCSLAPYDEDVEIWACNEEHAFKWMKRATRWFQMHKSLSWKREVAKRGVIGHYEWLKENPLGIPIYMQYKHDDIPGSVEYPLREACVFLDKFRRGNDKIKYFTSSFAYMIALALMEGFERIELYGFEMSDDEEYIEQKACAEFWIGLAMGLGVEIYTPPNCQILNGKLYGYT